MRRRALLRLLAGLFFLPLWRAVAAGKRSGFDATTQEQVLAELYPGATPRLNRAIHIDAFDLAEDGASVPIKIHAALPRVQTLAVLVRDNPSPLLAVHQLGEGTEAVLELHIKMARSSDVTVVAQTGHGLFMNQRHVGVAVGGCGDP